MKHAIKLFSSVVVSLTCTFILLCSNVQAQSVGRLYYDTTSFRNRFDSLGNELDIRNSSRHIYGPLANYGNGRTRFQTFVDSAYALNDSTLRVYTSVDQNIYYDIPVKGAQRGSVDTFYVESFETDSIIIFRAFRLPLNDTANALQSRGYAIYDTIINHFYGYTTSGWACLDCGGGGGASVLGDLTDVNLSSLLDGQPLVYDSATSKWINNRLTGTGTKLLRANSSGQLGRVELSGLTMSGDTLYSSASIDTFLLSTRAWRDKLADSLGAIIATKGTVTSVATNDGTGITGGTITGIGTLAIDTFNIGTKLWLYKVADSLSRVVGPWKRDVLSGASASTNIVHTRTIADTIVTGGIDVIGSGTSPLFKFNHSGTMGVFSNGLGAAAAAPTADDGLVVLNTTAAALGAQQWSPIFRLRGYGWATTGSTSQSIDWGLQVETSQGGAADGNLVFKRSLNGASYGSQLTLTTGGNLTVTGNITASGGTVTTTTLASSGALTLQSSAATQQISFVQGSNRPVGIYATTQNFIAQSSGAGTLPTDPNAQFSVYRGSATSSNTLYSVTSGSATVAGTTTQFLNQFRPGDNITISGTTRVVQSVASNTSLTTTATWPSTLSNQSATVDARYAMQVKASGKVGIFGITNPTASLHIGGSIAAIDGGQIKLDNGVAQTTAEAGVINRVDPQLQYTNGDLIQQEIPQIQQTRVSTQFDKTSDASLANITGLTASVAAGKTYRFEAILYTTSPVAGGVQFAIGGTATATNIIYEAFVNDNNTNAAETRATALGTAVGGVTAVTAAYCKITGTITVNAAGTLTVQFAQNSSNGTASSVLVGSNFVVTQIL